MPDANLADLSDDLRYEQALGVLADLTDRLLDTVKTLDDAAVRAPSLCPGWTRGHVLTHVARNADALRNLLTGARTGVDASMYPSREARDADIEAGSGRRASELEADVEASAERLLAAVAELPVDRRHVQVRSGNGALAPAHDILWWRIREVAYHHVDLDAGYTFDHVSPAVLVRGLDEAVERVASAGAPPLRLVADDVAWTSASGVPPNDADGPTQEGADDALLVRGRLGALLAWLTGRSDGADLVADRPLPTLPAWG